MCSSNSPSLKVEKNDDNDSYNYAIDSIALSNALYISVRLIILILRLLTESGFQILKNNAVISNNTIISFSGK